MGVGGTVWYVGMFLLLQRMLNFSQTWDQFARDWNKPVHNFLLRHVYHSSISAYQVSKPTATLITFFLSACVHELVYIDL